MPPELLGGFAGFCVAVLFLEKIIAFQRENKKIDLSTAVNLFTATFRDRIYHASAGLPEFGFVAGAGNLELLHHIFAELKRNASTADLLLEKSVVVVRAVNHVIVEISGHPVKADHSEIAVRGGTRRQQNEIGEVAPVQR